MFRLYVAIRGCSRAFFRFELYLVNVRLESHVYNLPLWNTSLVFVAWEPSSGNFSFVAFAVLRLGTVRVESSSYTLSLGNFRLEASSYELSLGTLRLDIFALGLSLGSIFLDMLILRLSFRHFRLGTLAQKLSLGNVRLETSVWHLYLGRFCLGALF